MAGCARRNRTRATQFIDKHPARLARPSGLDSINPLSDNARAARSPAGHPLRVLRPRRKRPGCLADTTFGPSLS
eukprot:6368078-Alexandrium_andersonii.AAC.1